MAFARCGSTDLTASVYLSDQRHGWHRFEQERPVISSQMQATRDSDVWADARPSAESAPGQLVRASFRLLGRIRRAGRFHRDPLFLDPAAVENDYSRLLNHPRN